MKRLFFIFTLIAVFFIVGCDKESDIDLDLSTHERTQKNLSNYEQENYGEVVHFGTGTEAKSVVMKTFKINDDVYGFGLIIKNKSGNTNKLIYVCDLRVGISAITHDVLTSDGRKPNDDAQISIMEYRPGTVNIREADENRTPVFSSANGDSDFVKGLQKVKTLDPKSVVAFTIEEASSDGNYYTVAWSNLMTAKQLSSIVDDIKLPCKGYPLADEETVTFRRE